MSEKWQIITTIAVSLCGSGGIVLWLLNYITRRIEDKDQSTKDIKDIKEDLKRLQSGLVMCLENDCVIFHALKSHQINGDSEKQEEKMRLYFLSLLDTEE